MKTKRKIGRKIISFLITMAMVVGMILGMSLTAYADTSYDLWVGGTQVTSANASDVFNDNKVSYDAGTNTLTLNNANITSGYKFQDGWGKAGIYYNNSSTNLNIVLEGNNFISGSDIGIGMCGDYYYYGKFKLSGDGTLTTEGTSSGIYM